MPNEEATGANYNIGMTQLGENVDSNDVTVFFFAGHGGPISWSTHSPQEPDSRIQGPSVYDMKHLNNKDMLPVCVVGGCHNSMFNNTLFSKSWMGSKLGQECRSWRLTRKIGGGSIATIGNTALGYGPEDKLDPSLGGGGGYLSRYFFTEYSQNKTDILGKIWANTITTYLNKHPIEWDKNSFDDTTIDAKTVQEWVLMGDPSLKIGGYIN